MGAAELPNLKNFQIYNQTWTIIVKMVGLPRFSVCLFVLFIEIEPQNLQSRDIQFKTSASELSSEIGYWPSSHCQLSNCYFKTASKTFYVGLDEVNVLDRCCGLRTKWNFGLKREDDDTEKFHCDQVFDIGLVFNLENIERSLLQLHLDTVFPLHAILDRAKTSKSKGIVLMPTVEKENDKVTDWDTDAFLDDSYWMQVLKTVADPYRILPLDRRLAAMQKTMCFRQLKFGLPKVNLTREFVQNFVSFVKHQLNISHIEKSRAKRPVVGIIEAIDDVDVSELLDAANSLADAELVQLQNQSFRNQVIAVQKYNILVGSVTPDFTTALYLPASSVLINVLSNDTQSQVKRSFNVFVQRGPYLELNLERNVTSRFVNLISDALRHLSSLTS